jgi:pyruvate ferredoxin oxidoreductase gamma subunit
MTEIRIHGRGGQGNIVGAYVLAQAAFEHGLFAQAFPSFGPERRGAPVAAYVRIADRALRRHCAIRNPSFLIIQDDALLHAPGIADGLKPSGAILVNSPKESSALGFRTDCTILAIPASQLASEILGRPIPNTALLAAFLALTGLVPLQALEKACARRFNGDILERNLRLIRATAARVPSGSWKEAADARAD